MILWDTVRYLFGGDKKKKPAFSSEKEAYDFCRKLYNKNDGVAPELLKAYEFYQKNYNDGCEPFDGPKSDKNISTGKQRQLEIV